MRNLIFVDCEARGTSPVRGTMTEFGAVQYPSRISFHGRLFEGSPDPENPAVPVVGKRIASNLAVATQFTAWIAAFPGRAVMVSDNPAYDFMWIAGMFDAAELPNPLGHSARRISDFWSGLNQDWSNTQGWKRFRKTPHDHHPVNDAMGNLEAFEIIMQMMREGISHAESAWVPRIRANPKSKTELPGYLLPGEFSSSMFELLTYARFLFLKF